MMSASPPLRHFRGSNPPILFRARTSVVEVSNTTLRDHGFYFPVEGIRETLAQGHFVGGGGLDDLGVEEDLVGGAEGEVELVLEH